jgi:hypothetical protein
MRDACYDDAGQFLTAKGKERGGTPNRRHEQFGYAYDPEGNLQIRTNNAPVQSFIVNALNSLVTNGRLGTLTVSGATETNVTSVTLNGTNAALYSDRAFASTNHELADGNNTFTAVARANKQLPDRAPD